MQLQPSSSSCVVPPLNNEHPVKTGKNSYIDL